MTSEDEIDNMTLRCALQFQQMWKDEIEHAVDKVKNHKATTTEDKWFRKMWYIAQARDRKCRVAAMGFSPGGN